MKKYLREIELSGAILCLIGVLCAYIGDYYIGAWICGVGLLVLLVDFLYKAFHWKEYERENKRFIVIMLIAIVFLFIQMILKR